MKNNKLVLYCYVLTCFLFQPTITQAQWSQIGQTIVGEAAQDYSGNKVSISSDGKIVAIGALGNDGNGEYSGQVRVYEFIDSTWNQMGSDIDGEYEGDYSGSAICLSDDGKTLIIGASNSRANEFDSLGNRVPDNFRAGQVKIYRFDNNEWVQLGEDIDGTSYYNLFGSSVSISGDGLTVAAGARGYSESNNNEGFVLIYKFDDGKWNRIGFILGEEKQDYFGNAVSLNSEGSRLAIGAYWNSSSANRAGHVRVFEQIDTNWIQIGSDIGGEAEGDEFGYSVELNSIGDTFIAGAYRNDGNGDLAGHARVFEFVSGEWVQKGMDLDGEFRADEFGWCVSIDSTGNTVAVGSPDSGFNSSLIGLAKIFELNKNEWIQIGQSIEGLNFADHFGRDIDLSADGSMVAIGSSENDDNGKNSGHVRVFKYDNTTSVGVKVTTTDFQIYPNPTQDIINIDPININENIEIRTLTGKLVVESRDTEIIDVSELTSGVYIVKCGDKVSKFVKK